MTAAKPSGDVTGAERLTPRAALAEILSLVGERAWSQAVASGAGEERPGDLTRDETSRLATWSDATGLRAMLLSIRLYVSERPSQASVKGRTGRPSRRGFNDALRRGLGLLATLAHERGRPEKAPRALALLLLLHGIDAAPIFAKRSGETPADRTRIAWLVERIGEFVEQRAGSYQARKSQRAATK